MKQIVFPDFIFFPFYLLPLARSLFFTLPFNHSVVVCLLSYKNQKKKKKRIKFYLKKQSKNKSKRKKYIKRLRLFTVIFHLSPVWMCVCPKTHTHSAKWSQIDQKYMLLLSIQNSIPTFCLGVFPFFYERSMNSHECVCACMWERERDVVMMMMTMMMWERVREWVIESMVQDLRKTFTLRRSHSRLLFDA